MKKLIIVLIPVAFLFLSNQCKEKEKEITHDLTPAQLHLWAENVVLDVFKQIQIIVKDTSFHLLVSDKDTIQTVIDCATIELIEGGTNGDDSLFIKYGNSGCSGINDYIRKGTITAVFDGKYNDTLTNINVLFESYSVNGIGIKRDLKITSLGVVNGNFVDIITADTMVFSTSSGDFIWGGEYRMEWTSGSSSNYPNIGDDTYEISGSSYSYYETSTDEVEFNTEIVIPLTYKLNCKSISKGLSELDWGAQSINTLDYGDGSCDNVVRVTIDGNEYSLTTD